MDWFPRTIFEEERKIVMNYQIPLFKMHWTEKDVEAVSAVLRRGTQWAAGPEIEEFEKALAQFHGKKYALTFNSGTSALIAMYKSIGVEGKEVIVPSFTFIATANAVILAGGIPVFAESEEETLGLDAEDVKKKITKNTTAIVALHYGGGVSRDIEKLQKIAAENNLILLEDNAHSLGVRKKGIMCGTFGEAAVLSFCQNKLITTGEGGAVITDSQRLYEKMKLIRSHGRVENSGNDYFSTIGESQYVEVGYNLRMPTMNAALGMSQLENFTTIIEKRLAIAKKINSELSKILEVKVPRPLPYADHFYQMYTIMLKDQKTRDELQQYLFKKGIMAKVYYSPAHLTSLYRTEYRYREGSLPQTEKISREALTLPIYPTMSEEEREHCTNSIREFFDGRGALL
jgi:perosamine synthetase